MGEYGWWGNGGIFGSWVKYGRNMKVGKYVRVWGEVREGVGRCAESVSGCGVCGVGV